MSDTQLIDPFPPFPPQGAWTEREYLALDTNRLVEYTDGFIEVLPMPTAAHQLIVAFLYETLKAYVTAHGLGLVLFAPLSIKIGSGKYRQPDIVFLRPGRLTDPKTPPDGADLVMEVVSEGAENRQRDLDDKRKEYAAAGIPEYWIVDPQEKAITVLILDGAAYREHGVFKAGKRAESVVLVGFGVAADDVLAAANPCA